MQTATRNFPSGDLRVSDADRDWAVSELSEAFQAGRITADEFGQRSGQALAARTGKELTALLTDLPLDRVPAVRTGAQGRARVVGTWIVMAASAAAAIPLAAAALSNALSTGPSLAVREARRALAQQVLAHQGITISVPLPPAQGFDWAGTITPAVFAILLIGLIAVLAARTRRAQPTRVSEDRAHRLSPRRRRTRGTEGRRAATRGRAVVGQRRARGPGHRVSALRAVTRRPDVVSRLPDAVKPGIQCVSQWHPH